LGGRGEEPGSQPPDQSSSHDEITIVPDGRIRVNFAPFTDAAHLYLIDRYQSFGLEVEVRNCEIVSIAGASEQLEVLFEANGAGMVAEVLRGKVGEKVHR
jgi:hypothetical protein